MLVLVVVYFLLGGLLCWFTIESLGGTCRVNDEDEHASLAGEDSNFLNEEDDSVPGKGEEWPDSSEHEFSTDWCSEDLKESKK